MKVSVILSVLTLSCTVSSLPGVVRLVQSNPVLLYAQPTRSIITPFQYQVPSVFPVGLRLVQQPVLQTTVLRNVPRSNSILASTRVIPNNGALFANLRSQNSAAFRNDEQNDAVVIDGVGSGSNNNIPAPVPVQDNGGQETPSQSYGYGVPAQRFQPQQAIRTSYGAPIPQNFRNVNSNAIRVNTITRQQPVGYEIQRANFVGEFRTASQGPIFPVTVIARNVAQRNQNSGYQLSRQNSPREPVRSASRQQPRSQGGYSGASSGVSPIPVRSVFAGNNRLQYYTVRLN